MTPHVSPIRLSGCMRTEKSYVTFSLSHALIVPSVEAAVAIVHDHREGHRHGRSRRHRWRAWSRLVTRGKCPAKSPPLPIDSFSWRVPQHPLRLSACGVVKWIDRAPFPLERKGPPWWIRLDSLRQPTTNCVGSSFIYVPSMLAPFSSTVLPMQVQTRVFNEKKLRTK